jgi:hypothetical protein
VTNTCSGEITIQVDAGTNWNARQHKLAKGAHGKYSCLEAHDSCNGVKISLIGIGSEQGESRPSPPKNPTASRAALDEAKKKADDARAKAREAAAKAAQKRKDDEAEKKKLKEAANKLPSWCEGMVRVCENRNSSLANLSSASQSQCNAYCTNLQIENCNSASSTIKEAAQKCTEGAERDQKEVARKRADQKRAEEERKKKEEEERRNQCFQTGDGSGLLCCGTATLCEQRCFASNDSHKEECPSACRGGAPQRPGSFCFYNHT